MSIIYHLKEIDVYYLCTKGNSLRHQHMKQLCNSHFLSYHHREGPNAEELGVTKQTAGALGIATILHDILMKDSFHPFLFLEDDVDLFEPDQKKFEIEVPIGADAVYLGISNSAVRQDKNMYGGNMLRYRHPQFSHLFYIWNMLSTHAILFVSKAYTLAALRAMTEAASHNDFYDTVLTRLSYSFQVFALATPLFYQNAKWGGQESETKVDWSSLSNTLSEEEFLAWKKNPIGIRSRISTIPVCSDLFDLSCWKKSTPNKEVIPKLLPLEKKPGVTVVTAYYEVLSKLPKAVYQRWASNFLSGIACNLIIFTDTLENARWLQELRSKFESQTRCIVQPFHQLWFQTQYGDALWKEQHERDPEKRRHSPQLYVIWHEKIKFVTRSIALNPFKSTKFVWCDIGYFRDAEMLMPDSPLSSIYRDFPVESNIPNDKILFLEIVPWPTHGQETRIFYDHIGGGLFAGTADILQQYESFYCTMFEKYKEEKRFLGKDQILINAIYLSNKSFFQLIPSQYNIAPSNWFYLAEYLSYHPLGALTERCLHQPFVVAVPIGGLGNRMKCMVSAWRESPFAKVEWLPFKDTICPLDILFDNYFQIDQGQLQVIQHSKRSIVKIQTWRLKILPCDPIPAHFSKESNVLEVSLTSGRDIDFEYNRIPSSLQKIFIALFKRFILHTPLQELVSSFLTKHSIDIGVHIRSWNDCPQRRHQFFRLSTWIHAIKQECKQFERKNRKRASIYLTTDDPRLIRQIQETVEVPLLTSRSLSTTSLHPIQRDLIEMYLLSTCHILLASRQSTFSEVAWYLGECKAKVIIV